MQQTILADAEYIARIKRRGEPFLNCKKCLKQFQIGDMIKVQSNGRHKKTKKYHLKCFERMQY